MPRITKDESLHGPMIDRVHQAVPTPAVPTSEVFPPLRGASPATLFALQRTVGNAAVTAALQPQAALGAPLAVQRGKNDKADREERIRREKAREERKKREKEEAKRANLPPKERSMKAWEDERKNAQSARGKLGDTVGEAADKFFEVDSVVDMSGHAADAMHAGSAAKGAGFALEQVVAMAKSPVRFYKARKASKKGKKIAEVAGDAPASKLHSANADERRRAKDTLDTTTDRLDYESSPYALAARGNTSGGAEVNESVSGFGGYASLAEMDEAYGNFSALPPPSPTSQLGIQMAVWQSATFLAGEYHTKATKLYIDAVPLLKVSDIRQAFTSVTATPAKRQNREEACNVLLSSAFEHNNDMARDVVRLVMIGKKQEPFALQALERAWKENREVISAEMREHLASGEPKKLIPTGLSQPW